MSDPGAEPSSSRVILPAVSDQAIDALVGGKRLPDWAPDFPTEADLGIGRLLSQARHMGKAGAVGFWCHRHIVDRDSGLVVGGIGFKAPPVHGVAEIGYGVVPSAQGKGLATEAVITLVRAAAAYDELTTVTAQTLRDNRASQRVLEKAGFRRDDSGDLVQFALDV